MYSIYLGGIISMRYFLPLLLQKKLYIEDRIKCNYKSETIKNKNYEEECFS